MEHSSDRAVCHLREKYSSCEGLSVYGEYEGKWYCVLHLPSRDKEDEFQKTLAKKLQDGDFDFSGIYFPAYLNFDSFHFNSEANFSDATFYDTAVFFGVKFKDANFNKATFVGTVDLSGADFEGTANFNSATFCEWTSFPGVTFNRAADFTGATFKDHAGLNGTEFKGEANFYHACFDKDTDFTDATFDQKVAFAWAVFKGKTEFTSVIYSTTFKKEANFLQANFEENLDFSRAVFEKEANFFEATFGGRAAFFGTSFKEEVNFLSTIFKQEGFFSGTQTFNLHATVDFCNARIEKPDQFSLRSMHLRPSWFIDIDTQKFDFSDIEWFILPNGDKLSLEDEIEALKNRGIESPQSLRKLTIVCRRLMINAEKNHDYPTSNEFHYWSMEAKRQEGWRQLGLIATLYWVLSGYGERPRRAFCALLVLWLLFTLLYLIVEPSYFPALSLSGASKLPNMDFGQIGQAAVYSLGALTRLNLDPKPDTGWFQLLVIVEGILGPLQIALFLLAVRRKVMR